MKTIILVFASLFLVTGFCQVCMAHNCCQSNCVEEKGIEKREMRHIDSFKSINIRGSFVSVVTANKKQSIEIIGDKNIVPYISTEVQNQKLSIFPKRSICTIKGIKILISTPDITKLESSGSNNISITGINNQNMSIKLRGTGNLNISGNTNKFVATQSGANSLDAKDLWSKITNISVSGSSKAKVHASENLDAKASGAGQIDYYGNPKIIKKKTTGVGKIINAK